jgi:hypothetical protein
MATPTKTATAAKKTTSAPAAKKAPATSVKKPALAKGKEISLDDDDEDEVVSTIATSVPDVEYSAPEMAEAPLPIDTNLASRLESHGTPEVAEHEISSPAPSASSSDQTMDLPSSFDLETNPDGSQRLVLECFTVSCLTCTHLVSDGAKDWSKTKKCHTKDGNASCPSGTAKVVFVGLRNHYLNALNEARLSNDSSRVMRIMAKLEAEPFETRQYVLKKSGVLV